MTTTALDEKQILEELAAYSNRKLLLWKLAADGRDFCGVRDAAREHGLENESVAVQVSAFIEVMTQDDSIRDRYDSGTDWGSLEDSYSDHGDKYCQ